MCVLSCKWPKTFIHRSSPAARLISIGNYGVANGKIPFLRIKTWDYNWATVSLITQKILVCDMKFFYTNISKNRNVILIFQNFQNVFQKLKK